MQGLGHLEALDEASGTVSKPGIHTDVLTVASVSFSNSLNGVAATPQNHRVHAKIETNMGVVYCKSVGFPASD